MDCRDGDPGKRLFRICVCIGGGHVRTRDWEPEYPDPETGDAVFCGMELFKDAVCHRRALCAAGGIFLYGAPGIFNGRLESDEQYPGFLDKDVRGTDCSDPSQFLVPENVPVRIWEPDCEQLWVHKVFCGDPVSGGLLQNYFQAGFVYVFSGRQPGPDKHRNGRYGSDYGSRTDLFPCWEKRPVGWISFSCRKGRGSRISCRHGNRSLRGGCRNGRSRRPDPYGVWHGQNAGRGGNRFWQPYGRGRCGAGDAGRRFRYNAGHGGRERFGRNGHDARRPTVRKREFRRHGRHGSGAGRAFHIGRGRTGCRHGRGIHGGRVWIRRQRIRRNGRLPGGAGGSGRRRFKRTGYGSGRHRNWRRQRGGCQPWKRYGCLWKRWQPFRKRWSFKGGCSCRGTGNPWGNRL